MSSVIDSVYSTLDEVLRQAYLSESILHDSEPLFEASRHSIQDRGILQESSEK